MAWANAAADSPRTRGARTPCAGRPRASRSACVRAPARGARPTRRRGASERESGARAATDGTNARGERATRRRGWSEGGVARAERQTRREEEEEKTNTARERPCSTAAARATRGVRARRARRARVVCRSVRRSLASLEAATTEKTRDKDDDRRQRTGEDHHSGANTPARLRRREPPVVYARAARVTRASSVAPCAAPSLRSKRRPQKRRETRTTTGDREQEKIITVTNLNLNSCGPERACPPRGRASHEPLTSALTQRARFEQRICDIPVGAHRSQRLRDALVTSSCVFRTARSSRIVRCTRCDRDRDHWGRQGFAATNAFQSKDRAESVGDQDKGVSDSKARPVHNTHTQTQYPNLYPAHGSRATVPTHQ